MIILIKFNLFFAGHYFISQLSPAGAGLTNSNKWVKLLGCQYILNFFYHMSIILSFTYAANDFVRSYNKKVIFYLSCDMA